MQGVLYELLISFMFPVLFLSVSLIPMCGRLSWTQCDSSYGFSVIVRVTVTDFIIFQLELQLKLTNKMFFSYSYS